MKHEDKIKALNIMGIKYIARGENIEIINGTMPTEEEMQEALLTQPPPEPTLEMILLTALLEIQTLKNKVAELEGN